MKNLIAIAVFALAASLSYGATDDYVLTIRNHAFEPKELKIPAGKKIRLLVVNKDSTPAEFESKSLGREKIIPAKSTGVVNLGPLKPGRYSFVEEYHETEAAAQGTIVVE
ncbi:MAG: cupredoxin domain-containing protein [Rhodoferax sp.]